MRKELFIEVCQKASALSSLYWLKDYLADMCQEYDIRGYRLKGEVYCLNSLREYYRVSMLLRNQELSLDLFQPEWPIYTKTNDSPPTYYTSKSKIRKSYIANGCVIEGTIDGCIVGRNVKVAPGAVLKDCVILSNVMIGEDVCLDHVVVDKYAEVTKVKDLEGTDENLVYVRRGDRI